MFTIRSSGLALAAFLIAGGAMGAAAQDTKVGAAESPGNPPDTDEPDETPSIQKSLGPYGDPGGIRKFLKSKGITYSFIYFGEVLGNTSGGVKRGATYEGLLNGTVDVDLGKLAGVKGLAFHANAFQIHGRGLTGNNLNDLFTVSSIEAYPDTLLFEAWFEQKLADDKIAIRAGQLAADTEFFISQAAGVFVSATYGWPASYGNNLPSGGPTFPLATPGVRVKVEPVKDVALLAAVFNGDPAGPFIPGVNSSVTQLRDVGGVNFRIQDPPLLIAEGQFGYNQEKESKGLPGTLKLGYLHHFESFSSNDIAGGSLRGDDSIYGVIDQTIYRVPGTEDRGATLFFRTTASPNDRNVFDIYVDAGVAYKGLVPGRPDDTFGVAGAYGRISPKIARTDALTGAAPLIRDYQALIEATYQYTVVPGFSLQPDFQYVFHPGARGVADPRDGLPIRDAAIFGLRATIVY